MSDGAIKAYLEPKDKIVCSPALVNQVRLMLAVDSMRAYFRWFQMTKDDSTNLGKHDNLIATMAMAGWAWECINMMRKAIQKREKWLRRDMVAHDEKALSAWDEYIVGDSHSEVLDRLNWVRNKCFSHWDPEPARKCIERLGSQDDELPFVEFQDDGAFMSTRYPWVYDAIAGTLVDAKPGDTDNPEIAVKWKATLGEIAEIIGSLSALMSRRPLPC